MERINQIKLENHWLFKIKKAKENIKCKIQNKKGRENCCADVNSKTENNKNELERCEQNSKNFNPWSKIVRLRKL